MKDELKVQINDDSMAGRFSNMQRVTGFGDHYLLEFLARNSENAVCVARIYLPHSGMGTFIETLNQTYEKNKSSH